ncbi:MAG: cell envelope integrity protein TolA [Luteimonas sp.]
MRETRADTAQAFGLALLLHALLFALIFAGLWWTRPPEQSSAAGDPVSAELVDASALSAATLSELANRPEPVLEPEPLPPASEQAAPILQPLPEPLPEDSPVEPQQQAQQQIPDPDTVNQDAARRDAISELQAEREQQARRRQEQIDLTERQRQEAERRRRLSEMERERQQQIADIRRQREEATRDARDAQARLDRIAEQRARSASEEAARADAAASAAPGNRGVDEGLSARYAAALQEAILRNWTRPDNVPLGQRCRIVIRQIPGGQVISAEVDASCPYDALGRRSIEAAVLKAQPLPYAGFESVFNRQLNLSFEARDR